MSRLSSRHLFFLALVIASALCKVLTHPFSISPIIALSLFSGAVVQDRKTALAMPLFAMFLSDVMLEVSGIAPGFYGMGQVGNYLSLLAVSGLGMGLKRITPISVLGFSLASSLLFFFLSNTNCYLFDNSMTYGTGLTGWYYCLMAGLPFVKNGLVIDLGFSVLLFGTYSYFFLSRRATQPDTSR